MPQVKFIASSSAFAKALAQVTPIIATRPLVPAVECALLVGTGSVVGQAASVRIICSNLETTLAVKADVECESNFAALVPAKRLLETLRGLPDQPVTFLLNEETHTVEVRADRSRYMLSGMKPSDFPKVLGLNPKHRALTLPAKVLRAGLLSALVTARRDNLGAEFENVQIDADENAIEGYTVNIVGADNPNVSMFSYRLEEATGLSGLSFMLSRSPAEQLARLLSDKDEAPVTLLTDGVNVRLADGRWASRLAEGTYPAYQRVFPPTSPNTLWVDAGELAEAVRRLNKYAPGIDRQLSISLAQDAPVRLVTANYELSQAGNEEVAGEYQGEDMQISFNGEQLANLLALYSGKIEVGLGTASRAVVITDELNGLDYAPLTCLLVPLHEVVAA
jgi:DNA polymerase-3 subunit beta